MLCMRCLSEMPETDFHLYANNPVEKIFWGRLPVESAAALYYFTKGSLMQHLMHQLKYKNNRELGTFMGRLTGETLKQTGRFCEVEALIPLPLFAAKEKRRGYNQAAILCEGIAERMHIPVLNNVVIRTENTETQTRKGRVERWQNMESKFKLVNPECIRGKHILLIDDVVTTGATLEACGNKLLEAEGARLSLATLCYASG